MIQWKALILCPCLHHVNHKCNLGWYGSYHSLWQRNKVFSSKQTSWLDHTAFCITLTWSWKKMTMLQWFLFVSSVSVLVFYHLHILTMKTNMLSAKGKIPRKPGWTTKKPFVSLGLIVSSLLFQSARDQKLRN